MSRVAHHASGNNMQQACGLRTQRAKNNAHLCACSRRPQRVEACIAAAATAAAMATVKMAARADLNAHDCSRSQPQQARAPLVGSLRQLRTDKRTDSSARLDCSSGLVGWLRRNAEAVRRLVSELSVDWCK